MQPEPPYLRLYRSGELQDRVRKVIAGLQSCSACPRACGVDRLADETGVCGIGRRARVSSCFAHFGEEDCLRGTRGSGTIFFSGCNLQCLFCQNHDISQGRQGREVEGNELGGLMLHLQAQGCHNINLVTPEHVVPQVLEGLLAAVEGGLRLPLVYNTSGYDSVATLKLLDGVVDIYMPDFKYWDAGVAERLSGARDYPAAARKAIFEMHRQVGVLRLDRDGIAIRGVLVRHLVLPGGLAGTGPIMHFLAEHLSRDTYVNIMAQYRPEYKAGLLPPLDRRPTGRELKEACAAAVSAGLYRFDERVS